MTYITWRIDHIPYDDGWEETDRTTLTNYYDPLLTTAIGTGKDTFEFKQINFNRELDDFFKPNDKIEIYRTLNSETIDTDTDILMIGSLKSTPEDYSGSVNLQRAEGLNFSETIMEAIVYVDVENLTIAAALELAINNAGNKNQNFKVTWSNSNLDTKFDGSAFPTITEDARYFNKPLKTVIEKYSTHQKTEDGDYLWYINNNNEFIWKKKITNVDHSFDEETDIFKSIKIGKDIKEVKNYFILKGGSDPEGNQIQTKYVNYSSMAKHGAKYYFDVELVSLARDIIQSDLKDSWGGDVGANSYPDLPYTTKWTSAATGSTVTATTEKQYTDAIRAHIKAVLEERGEQLAELLQYGKLAVDIEFTAGTKEWGLASNVSCNIPQIVNTNKIMRVKQIRYSNSTDIFSLEEDKGSI